MLSKYQIENAVQWCLNNRCNVKCPAYNKGVPEPRMCEFFYHMGSTPSQFTSFDVGGAVVQDYIDKALEEMLDPLERAIIDIKEAEDG